MWTFDVPAHGDYDAGYGDDEVEVKKKKSNLRLLYTDIGVIGKRVGLVQWRAALIATAG